MKGYGVTKLNQDDSNYKVKFKRPSRYNRKIKRCFARRERRVKKQILKIGNI